MKTEVEISRCTGHCCRVFPLPFTYQEMIEKVDTLEDGAQVLDMIIPLPADYFPVAHLDFTRPEQIIDRLHTFTCRHLQQNGDCGIYSTRPQMCVKYPYYQPCRIKGCTRKVQKVETEMTKQIERKSDDQISTSRVSQTSS
jgi:Fe-S-cluster containining protein